MPNFVEIEETFRRRTDERTDERADGPTVLSRLGGVDLIMTRFNWDGELTEHVEDGVPDSVLTQQSRHWHCHHHTDLRTCSPMYTTSINFLLPSNKQHLSYGYYPEAVLRIFIW